MVGWHYRLNGQEFEWTPGVGEGQGGLACCSPWGRKELDTTEWLNWLTRQLWDWLADSRGEFADPTHSSSPPAPACPRDSRLMSSSPHRTQPQGSPLSSSAPPCPHPLISQGSSLPWPWRQFSRVLHIRSHLSSVSCRPSCQAGRWVSGALCPQSPLLPAELCSVLKAQPADPSSTKAGGPWTHQCSLSPPCSHYELCTDLGRPRLSLTPVRWSSSAKLDWSGMKLPPAWWMPQATVMTDRGQGVPREL